MRRARILSCMFLAACAGAPPPVARVPAPKGASRPATLRVSLFSSASVPADMADMAAGAESRPVMAPVIGALVEHPKGLLVFDPGPGALADEGRHEFPWSLFAGLVTLHRDAQSDAASRLRVRGLDPAKVRYVAFSHLHLDHACAAPDFESATYLVSDDEWRSAHTGPMGQAMLGYLRPCLEAIGQRGRLRRVHFEGAPYETFAGAFDVFDDGSVLLVPTPGHTRGGMSLLVWLPSGAPLLVTGDVAWVEANWRGPGKKGLLGRAEEWDPEVGLWSAQRIKSFAEAWPNAVIVPSHDPDVLARLKPWPGSYQ